ncbi:hypothetical protein BCON_0395g00010 [Botryotinia convoluta]|uniref:Uncharacterized protein n=1 Tax=Botryotinia convoluta TaxID=54673 RepID=A0A4Z1HDC4_9HELO|nr:hypothetical protein BCON_0395g00010 [Botryotinia convoluta]
MSNQPAKEESPVRDGPPVARDRSPASGFDAPNLVVFDRAEPDHGRSASGRSLYGPLRAGNPLCARPPSSHDPYDMNRYHAIHNNARTSYPVNSDTTMNNSPASNPPPYNSSFVNGARGDSPYYSHRPPLFEWNPAFTTDQTYPYSTVLRCQPIAPPAPVTASAAVPATRMTAAPAPAPAPPTARAAPATRSTRSRAREQPASTANSQSTQSTRSTRSGAKEPPTSAANSRRKKTPASAAKSAQKEKKQNEPWHDRPEYGIDRRPMTIRPDYGILIPRKDCFKNAPPGAKRSIECGKTESELVWTLRGARGAEQRRIYNERATVSLEDRLRATARMEAILDGQRETGRLAGYPAMMPIEDRFPVVAPAPAVAPVVAPAVAPVVAGNAAESTEDQEMADDDWVPPPGGLYSDED